MSARRCNRSNGDALQLQCNVGSVLSVPTNDVIWRKAWWRWQWRPRYLNGSNGRGIVPIVNSGGDRKVHMVAAEELCDGREIWHQAPPYPAPVAPLGAIHALSPAQAPRE